MKLSEQMQKFFDRYDGWDGDVVPYEYREEWPIKVAQLEDKRLQLQLELRDAAKEIHCAGTIAHRIRVLKREQAERVAQLEDENDSSKHEISTLRQLLDDDGKLALKAIEQQEGEIINLKAEIERLLKGKQELLDALKLANDNFIRYVQKYTALGGE